jgi:predicted exporter
MLELHGFEDDAELRARVGAPIGRSWCALRGVSEECAVRSSEGPRKEGSEYG